MMLDTVVLVRGLLVVIGFLSCRDIVELFPFFGDESSHNFAISAWSEDKKSINVLWEQADGRLSKSDGFHTKRSYIFITLVIIVISIADFVLFSLSFSNSGIIFMLRTSL
uniref:Uncharacterized protein n=1 Tax=Rhizophagus irregularis (strain DAOM 181602 / DAOM 197198 / MUCL 43194) TaxID=747089 RepID=U9TN82_RHIID